MDKKIKFSWETIHTGIESLAYQLQPLKPHLLVAIARGGLIPATLLSHKMNVPLVTISAESYKGTRRLEIQQTEIIGWQPEYLDNNVVFVDDIIDSGKTQEAVFKYFHARRLSTTGRYVTLINKLPYLYDSVNFCHVPKDVWVEFPWEQGES